MDDLPYDIKHYEILPRLDDPSRNIIRHILLGNKLKLLSNDDSCVLRHGLEFTKFWYSRGFLNKSNLCANAAEGGSLEILKWARANGCYWDKWTCANAAWIGSLEILVWARANGCPWDSLTWYAAKNGHLETLKWAIENGCPPY